MHSLKHDFTQLSSNIENGIQRRDVAVNGEGVVRFVAVFLHRGAERLQGRWGNRVSS